MVFLRVCNSHPSPVTAACVSEAAESPGARRVAGRGTSPALQAAGMFTSMFSSEICVDAGEGSP